MILLKEKAGKYKYAIFQNSSFSIETVGVLEKICTTYRTPSAYNKN